MGAGRTMEADTAGVVGRADVVSTRVGWRREWIENRFLVPSPTPGITTWEYTETDS